MRRIFSTFVVLVALLGVARVSAQPFDDSAARNYIVQLSKTLHSIGRYSVRFRVSVGDMASDFSCGGEYTVEGECFHLIYGHYEAYGEGELLYNVDNASRELTVDKVEKQNSHIILTNPIAAFDSLNEEYSVSSIKTEGDGIVLKLTPRRNAKQCSEMELVIDAKSYLPKCIIYEPSVACLRIDIEAITAAKSSPKRFQASAYEGYEVIDFR